MPNKKDAALIHPVTPAFKQVESTTMREQVTLAVRNALMNGHFSPGQPVTVKAISEMLGASVMPAREAMNRLTAEGALELRANRTVIVPKISLREFDELTSLRCHIEGLAAENAVRLIGAPEIDYLRRLDTEMHLAANSGDTNAYLTHNFQFHFAVYRLGASPFILSIIERLWVRAGPLIRSCLTPAGFKGSEGVHADMLDSLVARNAGQFRDAIVADITSAAVAIRGAMETDIDSP